MGKVATAPVVAVVTVTHNSGHAIERWIDALEQCGHREQMELCVVDSGSTPAERRFLHHSVAPRVDIFCERPNLGYGRSCNVGAELTTAPMLVFTNPDTLVRSLPDHVWRGEPSTGRVVGAFEQLANGDLSPMGFRQYPTAAREAERLMLGRLGPGMALTAERPAWVSGAALLISRADFARLHGFSPMLFMYFEDSDLCLRHRTAGGSVELDPDFVVEHGSGRSSQYEKPDRLASALDTASRQSARTFAAWHGHPWQRAALYALLVLVYVPRRSAVVLIGRWGERASLGSYVLDLLLPGRALRRLGAPD